MGTRATIAVTPHSVVKTYQDPGLALREAAWYRRVPWAAPRLISFDASAGVLEIERHTPGPEATAAGWRPVDDLRALLEKLHGEGIHHRDVHLRNVVKAGGGRPLLIDWETAVHWPAAASYDLHGPEASGVPVPDIHARLIPAWWGSRERMSITNQWEYDR